MRITFGSPISAENPKAIIRVGDYPVGITEYVDGGLTATMAGGPVIEHEEAAEVYRLVREYLERANAQATRAASEDMLKEMANCFHMEFPTKEDGHTP